MDCIASLTMTRLSHLLIPCATEIMIFLQASLSFICIQDGVRMRCNTRIAICDSGIKEGRHICRPLCRKRKPGRIYARRNPYAPRSTYFYKRLIVFSALPLAANTATKTDMASLRCLTEDGLRAKLRPVQEFHASLRTVIKIVADAKTHMERPKDGQFDLV